MRMRDALAEQITPEQLAEAERLVAEWEPNPAECGAPSGTALNEN